MTNTENNYSLDWYNLPEIPDEIPPVLVLAELLRELNSAIPSIKARIEFVAERETDSTNRDMLQAIIEGTDRITNIASKARPYTDKKLKEIR